MNKRNFSEEERQLIVTECQHFESSNIWIDDDKCTIDDLENKARIRMLRQPYSILVVDYIQIISTAGMQGNRQQILGMISSRLKSLAKELNITIVSLSQLTEVDKGVFRTREAADIENDSDFVFVLERADEKMGNNKLRLYAKKARNNDRTKLDLFLEHFTGEFRLIEIGYNPNTTNEKYNPTNNKNKRIKKVVNESIETEEDIENFLSSFENDNIGF